MKAYLKRSGDRIVPVRRLNCLDDVLREDADDDGDLSLVCDECDGLVDEADAVLVEHKLTEPWNHFLDDFREKLSRALKNLKERQQHVVSLVVEGQVLDVHVD